MKKILALTFLLVLLAFSVSLRNAGASIMPEFLASYSTNYPVIDGVMGTAEWGDANSYEISLVGATEISATIYFKHADVYIHKIYIGLKVFAAQHENDQFTFYFDEGDDGDYGSGTRDGILTRNQEDLKTWRSSPLAGYNIIDGYYGGAAWSTVGGGGDFEAEGVYVAPDSHWECEFAIPFVGNDGGGALDDVSDLVCTIADTIGFKIQYFIEPGGKNYYYPAGGNEEIETYAILMFAPPSGVIPEVPLGTVVASAAMIIAVGAYFVIPKFREKQISINP